MKMSFGKKKDEEIVNSCIALPIFIQKSAWHEMVLY